MIKGLRKYIHLPTRESSVISKKQMIIDVDCLYQDEKFMPLLPLLELSYQDVKTTYPGITLDNFHNLILYALDWQSEDHWQTKSMNWLENGLEATSSILDKINDLTNDSRMSETLKKRMRTLIENNTQDAAL